jgi:lipoate-protein ligase A
MAVDEAILDCVRLDEVPATLRLYAWEPACFSLGYAQSIKDVDQVALSANGWNLVRRPTGGRAILHTDELTYAVIGPPEDPRLAGSVLESYRCLSQALLEALTRLKITVEAHEKPELASRNQAETANPVCFEVPSNYEITFLGKKLVGSAQARRRDGVLQHGSLPLWGDLTRILQVLVFKDDNEREEAARRLLSRAVTAEGALGVPVSWDQAAAAFVNGFENALNLRLQPGELTQKEVARAQVLVDEKYAHPRWTERI